MCERFHSIGFFYPGIYYMPTIRDTKDEQEWGWGGRKVWNSKHKTGAFELCLQKSAVGVQVSDCLCQESQEGFTKEQTAKGGQQGWAGVWKVKEQNISYRKKQFSIRKLYNRIKKACTKVKFRWWPNLVVFELKVTCYSYKFSTMKGCSKEER